MAIGYSTDETLLAILIQLKVITDLLAQDSDREHDIDSLIQDATSAVGKTSVDPNNYGAPIPNPNLLQS